MADIEGAFLQGNSMNRPGGKVYAKLPKEGMEGIEGPAIIEICKYVYGLADALRQWWLCLSAVLEKLNMKRSELDPCCYYWYQHGRLEGILAFHVDDLVMGGSSEFHRVVLERLQQRFPFKHWSEGKANFLGRRLQQRDDFSIVCDQEEYASRVKSAYVSRERRRQKGESLTSRELTAYRGILGAAS